jgi:hypothetical protein
MKRTSYTAGNRDVKTAKANQPASGSTVTITAIMVGYRMAYRITGPNGWGADFSSRLAAVNFTIQNGWHVRASALGQVAS